MKFSKVMHVLSVISGWAGIIVFATAITAGTGNSIFGISKFDTLFCAGVLLLIAIWTQLATMHHMMLEKRGELV